MAQAAARARASARATSSTSRSSDSGAAGGIIAKELSTAGFSVVVLEQGPRLTEAEFDHDEFGTLDAEQVRQQSGDAAADVPRRRPATRPQAEQALIYGRHGRRQQRPLHREFLAAPPE